MSNENLKDQLITACKILVQQKLDSGPFGNVSIRIPGTKQFLINPENLVFEELAVEDVVTMDLHGNVLAGQHSEPHPGEFIHREIYRARQDVGAIVHTHSTNTVLISLLGEPIQPYTQLGAALWNDQGIYHGFTGPVRTSEEGLAIAQALEQKSMVIAKNHGLFAVGNNIQAALWDMILADQAAAIHLAAKHLGLSQAESLPSASLATSKKEVRHKQYQRMWEVYVRKLTKL